MKPKITDKILDLNIYLQAINDYPLLTGPQEVVLARRIAQGDPEAREMMINSNLRLVVSIARQYMGQGNHRRSLADIIEEGNLGLIQAAGCFQPEVFKTRFSTYAAWWIKQSIRNSLRNSNWPMRIPAYMHTLLNAIRKEGITDPSQLDTPEGLKILKKVRGIRGNWKKTVEQVKRAMTASSMGMVECSSNDTCHEFLLEMDESAHEAAKIHIDREAVEFLLRVVEKDLDERERGVIKSRFGIDGSPRTLREVGEAMGLTRERVRQIEAQAMSKLKASCVAIGDDR